MKKKKTFIDGLVEFSKKHPYIFFGGILLWVIIPDPLPVLDDVVLATLAIVVGFKRLK